MNQVQIFSKEGLGEIRTVILNDNPYFVGIDVTRALEYEYPSQAVGYHCKGIVKLAIPSEGGLQETNVIPIGDVCRLIVKAASQSKNPDIKEKAEEVEKWIFDEVLPSIIKTGSYSVNGAEPSAITGATSYIKVLYRSMGKQGHSQKAIAEMIEMVARQYRLPMPQGFVKESPFEQLTLTVNVSKEAI